MVTVVGAELPQPVANGDAAEHAIELPPEVDVAQRIQKRVQGGVQVPDPGNGSHQLTADAPLAEGNDGEADEVGQEADGKGPHDDAQLAGGLDLLLQRTAGAATADASRGPAGAAHPRALGRPRRRLTVPTSGADFRRRTGRRIRRIVPTNSADARRRQVALPVT